MQEISNSLRQRLKVRPEPQVHPDADLLTAYTEQALPPKERNQVVEHLAECSYCREIVSLSLPEIQASPVAVQAAERSRWWIPAYRWAAVAATVAIAATLLVEKPWRSHFERPAPTTTLSDNAQPASSEKPSVATPAASQPETGTPASVQTANTIQPDRKDTASAPAKASRKPDAAEGSLARGEHGRRPNETVEVGSSAGVVGGVVGGSRQAPRLMAPMAAPPPPPEQPVQAVNAQAAPGAESSYAYKDTQPDFLNKSILSNQPQVSATEAKLPPEAPAARVPSNQSTARKDGPKINLQDTVTHQMDLTVVPPTTTAEQTPPSSTDSTLAKSSFAFKSTLSTAVHKTMATAKKMAAAKSAGSSAFSGFVAPGSIASPADADQQTAKRASREIHWRVTPEGRLQRSTDVGQWHQVVTQNPDIQFKVVQPHGSEVWAGGNNGTLIHSWNAGVNWSQLNVPDSSSSDITGIAIDGDNVQVKTSNGQTFVTNDHGKTWVPLQQPQ